DGRLVRDAMVGVERVPCGVREDHLRRGLADQPRQLPDRRVVDDERVVAEIEARELGAERGRRGFRLTAADLLHPRLGLARLLPELARLAALAEGERDDVR